MSEREHKGGRRFLIELEALADDHEPIRRLRHFLKSALRTWRLRARSIEEITPKVHPPAAVPEEEVRPPPEGPPDAQAGPWRDDLGDA